jgi:hypothetical protein
MVVCTVSPVVVAGSDTFGSNGVEVLAPLIPKTVIHTCPVAELASVAVMVAELRVDEATAYHSSKSVVYEGALEK